jgi:hypothetical protein
MFVLDTNVLSELVHLRPDPVAFAWCRSLPRDQFWTCSIVIAEMVAGIELLPPGKRKDTLRGAVEGMIDVDLAERILIFDLAAARRYGEIAASRSEMGRPIHDLDAQIAAIASVHNATLATRNTRDFEHCGVKLVNPWESR